MALVSSTLIKLVAVAGFLVLGLAGCAGTGAGSQSVDSAKSVESAVSDREIVASRASARWEALLKGELAKAYEYLSPGTRAVMPLNVYTAKIRPGLWKKAKVESVTCELEQCAVTMMVEYSYRSIESIEARMNEVWLLEDGKWWYVVQGR